MRNPGAIAVAAFIAAAGVLSSTPAHSAPLEVYGRLPTLEEVAVSPDGSRIAYVTTRENTRIIGVKNLADFTTGYGLRVSEQKLRGISWADDSHLMITTSMTTLPWGFVGMDHEWFMLQVLDVVTHKLQAIPSSNSADGGEREIMNVIAGEPMVRSVGGHTVLFVPGLYVTDRTLPALFRFDLATSAQRLLKEGSDSTEGWLIGIDGEIAAQEDYFEHEQRWSLRVRRNGSLSEVTSVHAPVDVPDVLGFGPETDTLLVQEVEEGERVWKLLSLKDGKLGPSLAEHARLQFPIEDETTHRMVGGARVDDYTQYVFFDPQVQQRWDAILHAFPGEHVRFESASSDFNKFVVRVQGAAHGFAYAVVDLGLGQAKLVGSVYEGIKAPLETRPLTYAAADGLQIPAYLTLPAGRAPQHLPLVVLPHGGPEARDTADFNWWSQAIADQGYAVLQPNYRGSALSTQHVKAGYGEWGRKMQTDLSDGVRYLAKEGIIDPARVCIVGGSYGGYAALAGVALESGVYRCAVSIAGPSDLKRMLHWVDDKHQQASVEQRYWDRFMGAKGPNDAALDAISPVKHIDAVGAPVLLIHGKDDTVVPFEQSTEMYDAMRHAKKDVELVTLKHEDHWLSRSETRLQMLQASVAFLRAHNPPE